MRNQDADQCDGQKQRRPRQQSRAFVPGAFRVVAALFFFLSLASRFLLAESRNVNSAFALIPSVDLAFVRWLNDRPTVPFLLFLNAWTSLVMMWPAVLVMRRLGAMGPGSRGNSEQPEPLASHSS